VTALKREELRDLARMVGLAEQVILQTGFLRRNMADHDTHDRLRFGVIGNYARWLVRAAERCERRAAKIRALERQEGEAR
jgi:hypothetical protein